MKWKISIQFDEDQADVGTITGEWTDPLPELGVFTFSKRIKANVAGANAFMAEAIAARNKWQVKRQSCVDKEALLLAAITAADPKAGV